MSLSNDAKQIDHIFCVCSFSLKWEMAASGRLGEASTSRLWSALSCATCAQPSSSGCCWHQFKPQFQPEDVAEITENPSQFPRIWWKREGLLAGWMVGTTSPRPLTTSSTQRLGLCLRCPSAWQVYLRLSCRLMHKHA